jgi:anti-sigma B factor antagonist
MNSLATIDDRRLGAVAVAGVAGEIDASNTEWIAARLRALVTNRSQALVVDLSETGYLDSAGIALLFDLGADLHRHQMQLHVVVDEGSPIARMISLTGLDRVVPVHPSVDAALAAV